MAYILAQLKTDVRKILDEQGLNDTGFTTDGATVSANSEQDDTEIDALVALYAADARNFVLGGCDAGLLTSGEIETNLTAFRTQALVDDESERYLSCVVEVSDALRIVRADIDNFRRGITDFITDKGSAEYMALQDPLTTGTPWSPKGAVYQCDVSNAGIKTRVEAYCLDDEDDDDPSGTLYYVKKYDGSELSSDVKVYNPALQSALRFYIAGCICETWSDERADNFFHLATNYMGISGKD